jgi:TrmH family RNA methyltransferase
MRFTSLPVWSPPVYTTASADAESRPRARLAAAGRHHGQVSDVISSASNPLVKRMRSLGDRRVRRREQAFVVEGVAPVWQAVDAGAGIEVLVVCDELLAGSPAQAMVTERESTGVPVARLSRQLFERVSDRDGPSGLAAVVRAPDTKLSQLVIHGDSFFVAAYQMASPGNLGTVIRAAEGLGASGVLLVGEGADPLSPQAVKASMGSLFHLPVVHLDDLDALFDWAARAGIRTVTTSAGASTRLRDADLSRPLAVLLGSERTGLPKEALARGSVDVTIPMAGHATSFNVAVAAGILMYEVARDVDVERARTPSLRA